MTSVLSGSKKAESVLGRGRLIQVQPPADDFVEFQPDLPRMQCGIIWLQAPGVIAVVGNQQGER